MPPKKHVEVESSSNNDDDLRGTVAKLSVIVNQLSATMVQMQKILARIETQLTNLENNRHEDNHQDDGGNNRNQRDPHAVNVDRDLGIKLVIPEYDGKLKPDEFMDWLVSIENIFAHKPKRDGHKITLVATRFRNYAAIWWAELEKKKRNQQIDPVDTLNKMKNLLKQKFISINYSRDLRSSFQDLKQGSKTGVEYSEELMTMQARCGLNEDDDDVLVDRYFNGLTLDIQHILTFKHFDNVDEIVQHAIKAEGIANHQARKLNASK